MTLERPSISSNIAHIAIVPQDSSSVTDNEPKKALKYKRELSWKIASSLATSFRYAWGGLSYAFETQRNFRIHTFIGTLAIGLGLYLQLKPVEISVIGVTIGIVLAMELLNTAIESVVDLTVGQSYHELAKIAKDCAAGAVLVSAMAAAIVAAALLLPPLWEVLQIAIVRQ
ncbi:diacylglycerol kinase family protein [Tychonema sp. LEGE 07199]|uniref:diacylglycerol kinase family protein n=1 Tax=Microcoleaceae TaxID=1892252 RepID=UPI00188056D2|nr:MULTISPECIES: diacylglycerol kinase family protein [unclassified Tychonema]MBE9123557.1 diacylglycerol kinase family protein [Tychonema sp. LEGE 07199]MBE9131392.1 diacylglycerol kinase family protein [Tychonema sp. LEGE 07196]